MLGYFYFQIFLFLFFKKTSQFLGHTGQPRLPAREEKRFRSDSSASLSAGSPRVSSPLSPEQPPGGLGVYKCGRDRGAPGSYKACLHTSLI